ncbi:MAG: hypothetical protein U0X91_05530 [Spirosomataceae bacterium]
MMKKIILLVLFVSIFSYAFAQQLPGTLPNAVERHSKYSFELEQGNKLIAYARLVQDLEKFQNIDTILAAFVKDYALLKASLPESVNAKVVVYKPLSNGQFQLDLSEHPAPKQRFQFKTNGSEPLLIKTVQDTLLIVQSFLKPVSTKSGTAHLNEQVYFCLVLNDLSDVETILKKGGLTPKVVQAVQKAYQYPNHNLKSGRYKFTYQQSPTVSGTIPDVMPVTEDFLAIHPSVGVGVMRNQFVPNIMVDFTVVPNRYGMVGYTLGWRSLFFTDRSDVTGRLGAQTNSFLHAGITLYDFRRPQSDRINTDHVLFGIYLGQSVTRSGSVFDKNTWNLSATVMAKGMLKIQPEVYFNGFFKNVMPGLRLQIGI